MQIKWLPFVNYDHDFLPPLARHGISLRWRREQQRDLSGAKLIMSRRSKRLQRIPFFSVPGFHQITVVFKTRPVCWYLMSESRPPQAGGGTQSSFSFSSCCLSVGSPPPSEGEREREKKKKADAGPPAVAEQGCQVTLNTAHRRSTQSCPSPTALLLPSPSTASNLHYNRRWVSSGLGWGAREGGMGD